MGKEIDELMEELCKFAELAKKEVEKIVKKGDLTPQELENVYKLTCIAEKMTCLGGGSYGYDNRMGMDAYGDMYGNMGYSEARGRSPVTGRYISRGMNSGNGGYSGHSIEDRMIASLEQQMDNAKSEYEKQQILQEIQHIRMGSR